MRRYFKDCSIVFDNDKSILLQPAQNDGVDDDIRAILDDPNPAEQARRFRRLVDKYPTSGEVTLRLAVAAAEAGLDHDALAALERSLLRSPDLDERTAYRLLEAARLIQQREVRVRALDAITRAKTDHTLAVRDLVEELAARGRPDDVQGARDLARRPGVWPALTLGTQEQLAPSGRAGDGAELPRFAHDELIVERAVARSPDLEIYEARRASGERVTIVTRPALDRARQREVARVIAAGPHRHPLIARPLGTTTAIGGAVFEILAQVRGVPWGVLYARPARDHEELIDRTWVVARALAAVGDTGVTLASGPFEVFVDDRNQVAPVTFLPSAFAACRAAGRTAPRTPDPFPAVAPVLALERYRDAWSAAALLYWGLTAAMPPHPFHTHDLADLPPGRAGVELLEVLTAFLGPTAGPQMANVRQLVIALDAITTIEARQIAPGDQLGPFRILDLLSETGGICQIWRAAHAGAALVAIKALRLEHIASRSVRAAHHREATLPPRQSWFPTIIDASGVDDRAAPWFALTLYDGENLADVVARGALDLRSTLQLGCEIVTGLRAAHAAGLVHGDLKTANIFLESGWMTPHARARARLLDWGCVQPIEGELLAIARVQVSPTSAPEVMRGAPVSSKVDVYGLGTVLYHAITGAPVTEYAPHPALDQHPRLRALVEAAMAQDPAARPSLDDVSETLIGLAYELELPWAARTRLANVVDVPAGPLPPPMTPRGTPVGIPAVGADEPVVSLQPLPPVEPEPAPSTPQPPRPPDAPEPRPVRWPYYAAAALMLAAAAVVAVRRSSAGTDTRCELGRIHDEASLHAEVWSLIGRRCYAEAERATAMLDDESLTWSLSPRDRDTWGDELQAAIEAAKEDR